jgi:hypothetical protein
MKDRTLNDSTRESWEWTTEVLKIDLLVDGNAKDGTNNILSNIQINPVNAQMLA